MEVIVALSIFTTLLLILASLQVQFLRFDRDTDLEMFDHPQRLAVLERLRQDVQDSTAYPSNYQEWVQSPTTLILRRSPSEVIVWSFDDETAIRDLWLNDSSEGQWKAAGVPSFEVDAANGPGAGTGVRLRAFDDDARLVFDQIIFPRAR